MDEREQNIEKPLSDAEKSGLAKKKAINKAASDFSDEDSLFEFEGFEIEALANDIDELAKKEGSEAKEELTFADATAKTEEKDVLYASETTANDREKQLTDTEHSQSLTENNDTLAENDKTDSDLTDNENTNFGLTEAKTVESAENNAYTNETENANYTDTLSDGYGESAEKASYDDEKETDYGNTDESSTAAESDISVINSVTADDSSEETEKSEDLYRHEQEAACNESKIAETDNSSVSDNLFDRLKGNIVLSGENKPANTTQRENVPPAPAKNDTRPSGYGDEVLARGLDHSSVNAEGQIHFEGTEPDFLIESESDSEMSQTTEASESEINPNDELYDDLYDEDDLDNEIWDRAGKEEWQARESFLSYCKSLTLPAPLAVTYGNKETEPAKAKANSSGYRFAESERIPVFSDGMYGGVDKAGYAERERRYCENRKLKRDIALREKTRSLHRSVLYTALILFTVFLLEMLNLFINGQTVLFASIEIGLTVLCAAFVWRGLADGLKCAVRGVFIPELLTFLTVLLSLVYGFITVFSASAAQSAVLIGLPGVGAMFLTSVYRSLMSKREKKVFDITADYGSYCTEVRFSSFKGTPEEIAFGGYADENSSLYRTNRIPRSDGGYNLQPVRDECFGLIKILLICIICAAIASGIAFGFIKRDLSYGIFSAYLLVCLSCPLSVFLSLSLPRYITALDVAEEGAAITDFDDESDELDENVIMLSEEELFPPEKIRILDTYWTNSHFLETHLSKAAAAFRRTGGLLSGLFSSIDLNPGNYRDVVITDISDGGITVKVDDSLVRAGTDAYLEKHGIEIERYPDIPQKDTRVLYIANNGEFFSRVAIQFCPDEILCRKMAVLRQSDTLFSLKTCNPCIDSALVFYTTGLEPELLRTVKYMVEDTVCDTDTDREGILISRTGARGLLSALLGYKRQKKLVLLGVRLAAISGLAGLALSLSVSLIGAKWSFISFIILGFHALMSGAAAFIGLSGKKPTKRNGKI